MQLTPDQQNTVNTRAALMEPIEERRYAVFRRKGENRKQRRRREAGERRALRRGKA